ncbi:hypothetical protein KFK09_020466 [Dendrobium nobile]|uniref:Sister chromatid cohesion 1 protein 1 n=1 Tax=Dendrobium nobile TaxID=94219 RepID=A0A8T3ALU5_DENNO|nr:hypothetical protein KFK09_020466 [Dendrobium nobile]
MFYSHQLLARKAPLGQIWRVFISVSFKFLWFYSRSIDSFTEFGAICDYRMAATLNNKIKRRNLEKLNIPLICEEILNPSIPMALRLSGILMGGVVNVYKRKVDFLYDDVNRFLEEFNRAFKAKIAGDSSSKTQAKRKAQARSEATITIADKENFDADMEQYTIHPSNPSFDVARFQKMTLKDLDDHYINIDIGGDDLSVHRQHHQADPADITLPDKVDLGTIHTASIDRFDRFDIGDDTFMEADFTSQVLPDTPPQVPQSPPQPQEPLHVDAMEHKQMEVENQPPEEVDQEQKISAIKEPAGVYHPSKRKVRGNSVRVIIDEHTMIPSETYQSWLSDTSDISSLRRRRKTKPTIHILRSAKVDTLMNLPPLCLMASSKNFLHKMYYPEPLMELWKKCTIGNPQTPPVHQKSTSHSIREEVQHQDFAEISQHGDFDIDQMMAASKEDFNLAPNGVPGGFTSSGSRVDDYSQPIHSSDTSHNSLTSGRSSKRQNYLSIGNLDTVAEDIIMPSLEPLEETIPTQTPNHCALIKPPFDQITESIRKQLKSHFDTPGNSQTESLNQLADGLTRKKAAQLFYHTCVMATMDYVKVEQLVPYGDISISRGPKM